MKFVPTSPIRRKTLSFAFCIVIPIVAAFLCRSALADVAVFTHHNDLNRTGANLNETQLTTNNVNTNQFGLLYTRSVDDEIHTQPLIATNVAIPGKGARNLVIVATVNDSVYAFDAEDSSLTTPLWKTNFLSATAVAPTRADINYSPCGATNYHDFAGKIGIVGTPVIDPASGTLYVVVRTKESGSTFFQRLWALDIRTGTEVPNGHVTIAFSNGTTFNPLIQNQRGALSLINGYVYITWSSHCDGGAYHGFIAAYNATNLLQAPITFNVTPSGSQAGIWMSDQALPADASGNIYLSTGNGTFDGVNNFGESFLKLTNNGTTLARSDWFTPYNFASLNSRDADLGSGGVLLIPGTNLLFSGGKAGWLYLINTTNMGHLSGSTTADTNAVQTWSLGSKQIHGGPVWWDGPAGSFAYIWPASTDKLRQYSFSRVLGKFSSTTPFSQSRANGGGGQPGGILSLSANGSNAGSGIVWASVNTSSSANQATVAGTLHAFDAQNVTNELWSSDMLFTRDALGNFAKFVAPTVANGKVYMATFLNRLNVYGLFPPVSLTVVLSPPNVLLSWPTNNAAGYALQGNNDLSTPNWSNVVSTVTISSGFYRTTIPTTNAATFYRLKK